MRFRPKTKRTIALTAAAVLTATAILPHMYLTPHAAKCKYGNENVETRKCSKKTANDAAQAPREGSRAKA